MTVNGVLFALLGGALIGTAATLLLGWNGRIAGISGILAGVMRRDGDDRAWQLAFLAGLLAGGFALLALHPAAFPDEIPGGALQLAVAGLLVGYGSRLGNGCTSGHGVCGISRLSARSVVATITFMATGAATVFLVRHVVGVAS